MIYIVLEKMTLTLARVRAMDAHSSSSVSMKTGGAHGQG
jgi:hypothetical protein